MKDRRFPTYKLYNSCNLLQLKDMTNFLASKLVHRSIYPVKDTPVQLKNYFTLNIEIHDRDVRDKLLVRLPYVKTVFGQSCIHWYGAYYWNRIEENIRKIHDIKLFKKELKTSILNSYQ